MAKMAFLLYAALCKTALGKPALGMYLGVYIYTLISRFYGLKWGSMGPIKPIVRKFRVEIYGVNTHVTANNTCVMKDGVINTVLYV